MKLGSVAKSGKLIFIWFLGMKKKATIIIEGKRNSRQSFVRTKSPTVTAL